MIQNSPSYPIAELDVQQTTIRQIVTKFVFDPIYLDTVCKPSGLRCFFFDFYVQSRRARTVCTNRSKMLLQFYLLEFHVKRIQDSITLTARFLYYQQPPSTLFSFCMRFFSSKLSPLMRDAESSIPWSARIQANHCYHCLTLILP